jgi:hypothetical protein
MDANAREARGEAMRARVVISWLLFTQVVVYTVADQPTRRQHRLLVSVNKQKTWHKPTKQDQPWPGQRS